MKTTKQRQKAARAAAKSVTDEQIAALVEKTGITATAVTGDELVPRKRRYTCEPSGRVTTDGFEIWNRKNEDGEIVSKWKVPPQVPTPVDKIFVEAVATGGMAIARLAELTKRHLTHVSGLYDLEVDGAKRTKDSPKTDVPLFSRKFTPKQALKVAQKLAKMRRQVRAGSGYEQFFDPPPVAPVQQSLFDVTKAAAPVTKEPSDSFVVKLSVRSSVGIRSLCSIIGVRPEDKIAELVDAYVEDAARRIRESA
jgi:hypothetical protein